MKDGDEEDGPGKKNRPFPAGKGRARRSAYARKETDGADCRGGSGYKSSDHTMSDCRLSMEYARIP
jgi:hypothetical protein